MKCLDYRDDEATMQCSNGHTFEIDAHTEENLYWDGNCNRPICPICKETHSDVLTNEDEADV